ncbi:cytochrome c biogenesis protein CcsA [Aquimarina sp. ERC-38]|uniref:cytochrome c biogenesis protein n=1 Tax=Aquimarina sp. ERC-38 TaxID=2949996 RepID=UPI002245043E|nr:cytochrome c biogenesis protein CcsA [Aquimarina sp. ERC-38]UZO81072.1 cytochrome c biogenesis protein CcsA [Aquimarina sp. ERC-38]
MKKIVILLGVFFSLIGSHQVISQQLHHLEPYELIERQYIDLEHTKAFASIQIQDFQGRIKPVHTLSLELLRKIYGKSTFTYLNKDQNKKKLTPTQVFLGMQFKPDSWQLLPFIKISDKIASELENEFEIEDNKYIAPAQFFDFNGAYKIKKFVDLAYAKEPGKRTLFDKEIIKVDERLNIVWGIFNGQFLRIFPNKNDPENKWFAPSPANMNFPAEDSLFFKKIIPNYLLQLEDGVTSGDWNKANQTVALLKGFQQQNGTEVLLSDRKVELEIWYNNFSFFLICLIAYTVFGVILLFLSLFKIFKPEKSKMDSVLKVTWLFLVVTFCLHALGIGLRWYISGHAPWSNGYEATVFIAWVGMLAGLLFTKNSYIVPSVAAIMAFCLLGIAQGSLMNPEITNLVPVLKSYWLLIHVAVITGSYGFLALGSLLAFITLLLLSATYFVQKPDTIKNTIYQLTNINQLTSTLGLYLLTIGTFLGGIWANESWGRYWGWDPKETWALISIIIYSFVLHIRIIIPKNYTYIYNVCSLFAIGSILMTFFGVNYYLSGLHSYAKGDSFPIPDAVYVGLFVTLGVSILPKILAILNKRKVQKFDLAKASL